MVPKPTNNKTYTLQCTCSSSHHAHIKRIHYKTEHKGSYMRNVNAVALKLLHGAALSRECCNDNLDRHYSESQFSQLVLSTQELT